MDKGPLRHLSKSEVQSGVDLSTYDSSPVCRRPVVSDSGHDWSLSNIFARESHLFQFKCAVLHVRMCEVTMLLSS